MKTKIEAPDHIEVRGAKVHNLKNIDVDLPLQGITAISGVSGSGKSSLALGVLYAEGSRRYLESLSTYTRRRMTQAERAMVDEVRYVPAALALRQRPGVAGSRSTFGTMTELLNSLRLMFSRLASHRCPNGHYLEPTLDVAAEKELVCPECGARFYAPGAEELAFNSAGACKTCDGIGKVWTVDESTLINDENLTIEEGAVAPWQSLMWSLMKDVAREMGVRTDVPFKDLTDEEKEIVFHGPAEKKHIFYHNSNTNNVAELDFTYYSAVSTVQNAFSKVKDEKGMKRVERFMTQCPCSACKGTRLSEEARAPKLQDISLDEACEMTLDDLIGWVKGVPGFLPNEMRPMAERICEAFFDTAARLIDLGLGYLSLDREAVTLSTGERQRTQLARAVRNRTTGVMYVLDEPSIGLHPANLEGLTGVMDDLVRDGNSVILVDHDIQVLSHADWMVELGKDAGAQGGTVIAQGPVKQINLDPESVIGPYMSGEKKIMVREVCANEDAFSIGAIRMQTDGIHTVGPLDVTFPKGRMTVVTGVSGSGKTTMVLESLIPSIEACVQGRPLPEHVKTIDAPGIRHVKLIDATPIGINIRSTVATYANVHDELRKVYARTKAAKEHKYKAGDFSYNTGKLRCSQCDGTGSISLDVQFLPDVQISCPACRGVRYSKAAWEIMRERKDGKTCSLPQLMGMSVDEAIGMCDDLPAVCGKLQTLHDLGLGYLTLGEETPTLSGGEAQRLKLASEMGKGQEDTIFVFDEPTIGLHPRNVETLLEVFQNLIGHGATVIVIEHDLDVIRNADHIIDMGPEGGIRGGRIVATGSVQEIRSCEESKTGKYL